MSRHLGVGKETTYGTGVAPVVYFDIVSESLASKHNDEEIKTIRTWSSRQYETLSVSWSGDIEVIANFHDIGILLKHFFGGVTTTGAADPWTHTFPPTTGIPAAGRDGLSLTSEVQRDATATTWRYDGGKITGFGFTAAADSLPKFSFSLMGKGEGTGTAGTPSYETWAPMLSKHIAVTFDGTALDAQSVNLNASFPVDEPSVLGSIEFGKEPTENDVLAVSGDVTVYFEDLVQYNKFDTLADVDIQIKVTDTASRDLEFNLNKCRLTEATPAVSGRERLMATYNFVSYYDTDATENLQIVLKNDSDEVASAAW